MDERSQHVLALTLEETTDREELHLIEVEVRTLLKRRYDAALGELLAKQIRLDLLAEEQEQRQALRRHERLLGYYLSVASQLLCHGTGVLWLADGRVAALNQPKDSDDCVTETPVLSPSRATGPVMRRISLTEVVRSPHRLAQRLNEDVTGDGATTWLRNNAELLSARLDAARHVTESEEALERRVLQRTFANERQIIADGDRQRHVNMFRAYAASHTFQEVTLFYTSSMQNEEADLRRRMVFDRQWFVNYAAVHHTGLQKAIELRVTCQRTAAALLQAQRSEALRRASTRSTHQLLQLRFGTWNLAVTLRKRWMAQITLSSSRGVLHSASLVERYFANWTVYALGRVVIRASSQFIEEHTEYRHWLQFEEAEARARLIVSSFHWACSWNSIMDDHFTNCWSVRADAVNTAILLLEAKQERRVTLRRFHAWHRWARMQRLARQAEWLLQRARRQHLADLYGTWHAAAVPAAIAQRQRTLVIIEEAEARSLVEQQATDASDGLAGVLPALVALAHTYQDCLSASRRLLLTRIAECLRAKVDANMLAEVNLRWKHFHRRRAMERTAARLERYSQVALGSRRLTEWYRLTALRCGARRVMLSRTALHDATVQAASLQFDEIIARAHVDKRRTAEIRGCRRRLARTPLVVCQQLLRLERLRTAATFTTWKRGVAYRQRRRVLQAVAAEECASSARVHAAWRFARWSGLYRQTASQGDEFYRQECLQRFKVGLAELRTSQRMFDDIALTIASCKTTERALMRGEKFHVRLRQLRGACLQQHTGDRFAAWYAWRSWECHRREGQQAANRLQGRNASALIVPRFRAWMQWSVKKSQPRRAESLRSKSARLLMRRYFRRLFPAHVRLARVSLAKRRLIDAQVAANTAQADQTGQPAPRVFRMLRGTR
jgi:hypothetical protein